MAVTVETGTGRPIRVAFILGAALLLASCGGSASHTTTVTSSTTRTATASAGPAMGEVLSVPAVGRIYGRCKPGEPRWPIEFVNATKITDGVIYRIGSGPANKVNLDPGRRLSVSVIPGQFRSRQPHDRLTRFGPQTIKATAPVTLSIDQGSEAHVYRVFISFVLAAAIGDTNDCALVSSSLHAVTYYPGGQPPS